MKKMNCEAKLSNNTERKLQRRQKMPIDPMEYHRSPWLTAMHWLQVWQIWFVRSSPPYWSQSTMWGVHAWWMWMSGSTMDVWQRQHHVNHTWLTFANNYGGKKINLIQFLIGMKVSRTALSTCSLSKYLDNTHKTTECALGKESLWHATNHTLLHELVIGTFNQNCYITHKRFPCGPGVVHVFNMAAHIMQRLIIR